MEIVFLLIPVSVLLVFGIAVGFWWSVKSGQFDDLEGPGFKVLMDDDRPASALREAVRDDAESVKKESHAVDIGQ